MMDMVKIDRYKTECRFCDNIRWKDYDDGRVAFICNEMKEAVDKRNHCHEWKKAKYNVIPYKYV